MPRAKKVVETVVEQVYIQPSPEEIQRLVKQGIREAFNPTAQVHRCAACAVWSDSVYEICRRCYAARAIPSNDSFISSFVGFPKNTYPADLTDTIKERLDISFEDMQEVINTQPEEEARDWVINVIRLAYRSALNPVNIFYPEVNTGRVQRVLQPNHTYKEIPILDQGSAVIERTPPEQIQWVCTITTPLTSTEKAAKEKAAEDALVAQRRQIQERHLQQQEDAAKRAAEEIAKTRAQLQQ